ncbi:MAG: hypothetical protein IKA99_07640 [Clostridia bacterium]|nr:hypothetical protein [Clostridia bacterium]
MGKTPSVKDHESPTVGEPACGQDWITQIILNPSQPIEIIIHNPHYKIKIAVDFCHWLMVYFKN